VASGTWGFKGPPGLYEESGGKERRRALKGQRNEQKCQKRSVPMEVYRALRNREKRERISIGKRRTLKEKGKKENKFLEGMS